ncbi:MAG: indole-3-glycerol phosphate synthase TrpC [Anaerolineaceae bacterium]|nr:MAG: indole-3-glycerol phosphate synthase TrpC [Anaerolineaceae bacterium]
MSVSKVARRRGTILDEIMAYKRQELPKRKRETPLANLRAFASVAPAPLDFFTALKKPGVSLIAECKKASPSKGLLVPDYDAVALANNYARAGASAISVLTDSRFFQGSLADLRRVKEATAGFQPTGSSYKGVPVLRKDFIFDSYQVYEARAAGADALLLIAAVLADSELRDLLALTWQLEMHALVEVHTEQELARVLPLGARIIGVNNRNLQTFEVDFGNTARLRRLIPDDLVTVAESGLKSTTDVARMRELGVDAILVGETLVKSREPFEAARFFVKSGRS